MKILRIISRIITGSVFIFSGFVKAVDPLGSAYKFSDYFQAFNLDFMKFLSLPLAIFLCTAEFITGVSVLTGFRQKTGITGIFILILFFTPLTFILALTNPVSDCGCFGDAIHLTNWQTFGKNVFLLFLILVLFSGRNSGKMIFKPLTEWSILFSAIVLFVCFSLYNLRYLPVIDFLPFKTGTNIPEKMKRPEGAATDQYTTTFIYEKDGSRKEFTINNYPANDSTWKFVEQKSVLVKKGYVTPIHDFSIINLQNEDITGRVINNRGLTVLMISKKLGEAKPINLENGFKLSTLCNSTGIDFYVLTASGKDETANIQSGVRFCNSDETTLKTIIRSNPGYVVLKNGVIIGKWSWADISKLRILLEKETRNRKW
jgi:uncharacterized membrane protein YphA (DoxX/SURF4 family)